MKDIPPLHGGDVYSIARDMGIRPEGLLDFSASINPIGFPPGVRQAVLNALDMVRHYPDPQALDLRKDLAAYHGLALEQILMGNGSTEIIYLVARALGARRAVVVSPAFSEYERALKLAGIPVTFYPTSESDGFTLSRAPECRGHDMVFLANPASPSGALLLPDRLLPIIEALDAGGVHTVLDEAFVDFEEEASMKTWLNRFPLLIILRSFTKFFGIPGIRMGYVLCSEEIVRRLKSAREPWSVSVLAQAAGRACLKDRNFMDKTRAVISEERDYLIDGLNRIDGLHVLPARANYVLIKLLRSGWTAATLLQRMLSHRILIRDAGNYHGLDARFFRIAVRLRDENDCLLEALKACLEGE